MADSVVRFSRWVRIQHVLVILLFAVLLVSGLPQRFPGLDVSAWTVERLGGIFAARALHRWAGYAFCLLLVAHLAVLLFQLARGKMKLGLFFERKDFADAVHNLKYYVGAAGSAARFGRYNYGQKFEYWGLIFGSLVMAVSGLILRFPVFTSRVLPAELIPVAKAFHSNEAMMAFLIVLVWHMYSAHLSPEVFPMDTSIFTGKISRERQEAEHPLE